MDLQHYYHHHFQIVFLLALFSSYKYSIVSAELQTIQLKSTNGEIEEIHSNVRDLEKVSQLIAKGEIVNEICSKGNSIWLGYSRTNYSETAPIYPFVILGSATGKQCGPGYPEIQSIRHVGNLDNDVSSISLYTREFQGHELYFNGNWLQLPTSETFESVGFTGTESWSLLEPQQESRICFARDAKDSKTASGINLFAFPKTNLALEVQFIWKGCGDEQSNAPRQPHRNTAGTVKSTSTVDKAVFKQHQEPALILSWGTDLLVMKASASPPALSTPSESPEAQVDAVEIPSCELRLTKSYLFKNLAKQGPGNWQLFSGRNYDGESYCLESEEVRLDKGIFVGSVKQHCGHPVGSDIEELPAKYQDGDPVTSEGVTLRQLSLMLGAFVLLLQAALLYFLLVPGAL